MRRNREKLSPEDELALKRNELLRREHLTFWLAINHHQSTKARPLDFSSRKELIPIYLDDNPDKTIRKSVQCGVTEYLITDALAYAEKGLAIFYVLPTDGLKNRFVGNRIDRLFSLVPYYDLQRKESVGLSDNMTLKHYGTGMLLFCGSKSSISFIEFPADMKIVDELDRCDLENLELADDRMSASEYKISRKVGNPTVKLFGIDLEYEHSDKKAYYFKCSSCNTWQTPTWFDNVVSRLSETAYEMIRPGKVVCNKCHSVLDRRESGQWIAQNPGARVSGYWISKLISPLHDAGYLFEKFIKAQSSDVKMQVFYNSDLGLPYSGAGVEITDEMLVQLLGDYWLDESTEPPSKEVYTTCGIDVGKFLHVIIRDLDPPRKLRLARTFRSFEELEEIIENYNVVSTVIDVRPESREAKRFQESQEEGVWLCDYLTDQGATERWDEQNQFVRVDRTFSLDGVFGLRGDLALGRDKILNPANAETLCQGDYYRHIKSLVRIFNPDRRAFVYCDRGSDHFAHAENYCKLATRAPMLAYGGNVY